MWSFFEDIKGEFWRGYSYCIEQVEGLYCEPFFGLHNLSSKDSIGFCWGLPSFYNDELQVTR